MSRARHVAWYAVAMTVAALPGCSDDPTGLASPTPVTIEWQQCNFDSVMAAAAQADRDLVVLVTAAWCSPCNVFRDSTWADPRVASLVDHHMTAFELDLTNRDVPLCAEGIVIPGVLGEVRGIPTAFIVRDGVVIRRIVGFRSPEAVYAWLVEAFLDR